MKTTILLCALTGIMGVAETWVCYYTNYGEFTVGSTVVAGFCVVFTLLGRAAYLDSKPK